MKSTFPIALVGLLLLSPNAPAQSPPPPPPVAEVKAAFLKLLDRPKVPLDARTIETQPPVRGVIREKVDFAVETRVDGSIERVPALVARPEVVRPGERLPAVVVLHGTGGSKEGNWSWLEQLARRGFLAIAIDGRYHGERAERKPGIQAYTEAIIRAWRSPSAQPQAHPFYYDTCWDLGRTVDYLQTQSDVAPDRIGAIGTSKGGIETWMGAAVDDRIKVAVPMIAVQSFRWSLDHDRWQGRANTIKEAHEAVAADLGEPAINARVCRALWSKVIPGTLGDFDAPSLLRLFSDRSLLIINGDRDPNCPIEGAEVAFEAARKAFHEAGKDDHLEILVAKDTGHAITPEQHAAALDWLSRWLKPVPSSKETPAPGR